MGEHPIVTDPTEAHLTDSRLVSAENDPEFKTLVAARSRLAWVLTTIMMVIYFGFILMIAFAPAHLGKPIGDGVTTIGIPIGIFVIVSAFLLTGIYVWRANSTFDAISKRIAERAGQ